MVHGVETLQQRKTSGYSEGHADSVLGHKSIYDYWFVWKKCIYQQCFLLPNPLAIFHLIYWMRLVYCCYVYFFIIS